MWMIALGFLRGSFNFFTTKPGAYLLVAAAIIGGLWYVDHRAYNRGVTATETVWVAKVKEAERVAKLEGEARAMIGYEVELAYLKKKAETNTVTVTVIKEVPRYVTKEIDRAFTVPCGLVRVWDAATLSTDPGSLSYPAGLADDTACPVKASALAEAGVSAIRGYIELTDQLTALQLWVETQHKLNSTDFSKPVADQVKPVSQELYPDGKYPKKEQRLAQADPLFEGFGPVGNDLPHTHNNALR